MLSLLFIILISCTSTTVFVDYDIQYMDIKVNDTVDKTNMIEEVEYYKLDTFQTNGLPSTKWSIELDNNYEYLISPYVIEEGWYIVYTKLTNGQNRSQIYKGGVIDPETNRILNKYYVLDPKTNLIPEIKIGNLCIATKILQNKTSQHVPNDLNSIICWDINTGNVLWEKHINKLYSLFYIRGYIYTTTFVQVYGGKESYTTTKINPYTGKTIWYINMPKIFMDITDNNSNSSEYIWTYYLKDKNTVDLLRINTDSLKQVKVNIDNIIMATIFKNYLVVLNNKSTLYVINPESGVIDKIINLKTIYKKDFTAKAVHNLKDVLLITNTSDIIEDPNNGEILFVDIDNPDVSFEFNKLKDKGSHMVIETTNNCYWESYKYNEKYSYYYIESENEYFGINEKTGQKTWVLPKSLGIINIYIVEKRGILAYVEKDDFKGLVCFGQK